MTCAHHLPPYDALLPRRNTAQHNVRRGHLTLPAGHRALLQVVNAQAMADTLVGAGSGLTVVENSAEYASFGAEASARL